MRTQNTHTCTRTHQLNWHRRSIRIHIHTHRIRCYESCLFWFVSYGCRIVWGAIPFGHRQMQNEKLEHSHWSHGHSSIDWGFHNKASRIHEKRLGGNGIEKSIEGETFEMFVKEIMFGYIICCVCVCARVSLSMLLHNWNHNVCIEIAVLSHHIAWK